MTQCFCKEGGNRIADFSFDLLGGAFALSGDILFKFCFERGLFLGVLCLERNKFRIKLSLVLCKFDLAVFKRGA